MIGSSGPEEGFLQSSPTSQPVSSTTTTTTTSLSPTYVPNTTYSNSYAHLPDLLHISSGSLLLAHSPQPVSISPPSPSTSSLPLPGIETFCSSDVPQLHLHHHHHQQHEDEEDGAGGGLLLLPPSPDPYLATFLPWGSPPPGDPGPPPAILQSLQPIRPELLLSPVNSYGRSDYNNTAPHINHQDRGVTCWKYNCVKYYFTFRSK